MSNFISRLLMQAKERQLASEGVEPSLWASEISKRDASVQETNQLFSDKLKDLHTLIETCDCEDELARLTHEYDETLKQRREAVQTYWASST